MGNPPEVTEPKGRCPKVSSIDSGRITLDGLIKMSHIIDKCQTLLKVGGDLYKRWTQIELWERM